MKIITENTILKLYSVWFCLVIIDVLLTRIGLQLGAVEMNTINPVNPTNEFIKLVVLPTIFLFIITAILYCFEGKTKHVYTFLVFVLLFLVVFYAVVAINNLVVIQRILMNMN